ncbi:MAG: DUF3768 domain-containing protein [Betaproteobacteria bacterium]
MSDEKAARIRELNDAFRASLTGGKVYTTDGISGEGPDFVATALDAVRTFDRFTRDNDPHSEHDFGSFEVDGQKLFWKIDYYDKGDSNFGAEDPSDPATTERVLTIMLAEEY